ncbi:tuberin [Coprinopsis cinerea okayama7|uniref:Tuberin n=1 Tax=Coprinopsis cinerea (strain Okayama-7 / 130 / ATCC MYA-4618 / FGSC 9003) TaxID=240176 RepID=D6RQ00_COPC7|nr:tuberin [Coprinopsis cinerea okayama7\|eukprot:XP_002910414.1 tuberin [Coprinopsis cinerea okayama7\
MLLARLLKYFTGTAYLSVKDSKQKDAQIPDIRFKSPPLELFPFADAPLPGGLVESDFTIELLIEMITSPTAPTPSHIHLLSVLLSKQTPPRFSALQPVLYRLCSRRSSLTLQALGYEVMAAYWNNSKVKNASWPTTSDALSCLTFFLDPKSRWHLDLWEVRFKALAAVTKDGTDLRGIETVVIEVIKDCILNAFRLLINPPKGMPVPPPSECERCIVVVGRFLHELFAYRANIARIKDDVLESVFQFYADLIDDHIHLPLPQSQTVLSPTEVHAVPERSTRRGHKRRAPSLTSFMFLASPTPTAEQSHPLPTKSKHPAEIAISLFLGHVGTHLLNLSKKQFEQVLPLLFRSLAFCASPLPRLTVEPQVAGPKTLENRIVEILNTLVPSPMSNVSLRILRKHLTPRHVGGVALPTAETPTGEENREEESDNGNGVRTKTASAAVAQDNAKAIRSYTLMIMTSLGASRTLRNYIRRALTTRLEKAYQPQQVAGGKEATGRSSIDQDLLDVAWLKHDHGQGRPATESGETRVISSSIDAWVGWSPGLPDLGKGGSPQGDMWDRIMEGKENILEEMAGIVKDIYQEFDSREDGGVHVDASELDHTNDALQSLAKYIFTLRSPDGSPFIINVFHPGESPTPLLRSITTLLSRDFHDSQKSLLADILIQGCEHVTDENTARIPVLMTDNYDLLPLTSTWLEHWKRLFDPRLLSVNRPHTRRTIIETLYEVYDSVRESQSYRKALAQLVMSEAGILIAAESSELVFSILEEEAISVISESDQLQETGAVGEHDPVQLLTSIFFNNPDESTALHVVRSLIHVFTEIAFKSLSFSTAIQEVAVTIFNTFLQALSRLSHPEPRVMILQFLMRWRADRDHRVYFALEGYDTNHSIAYMASLINRLPDSLMRAHKDEILEEHVARKRQHRSRTTYSRTPTSQGLLGRGRSQTVSEVKETKHHKTLWHLPETLPFKVPEPDTVKHGLRSFGEGVLLPISKYIAVLADLIETDSSWEVVSYILVHLPVQLANKHLFCGPTTRTSIIKLLYVLTKGVIDGSLASQTADDCPEGLKLRDLQGLAHHTLSTLISYKTYFDLQQRQLLIEAFFSGLNGQFSTIKCCLHALALTAFEMSTSLSRSLPKILEKLAQIMSNPNMAVHILAFLVMVGSLPTLYASFTEEDFKMVFGVALQYLQHYNQLQESPTRSWALSQHVRQQSFVTLYTWFSVLKLRDREIHIPYITRQLLLANEGREGVDGLTQVCFDWLARNTHGIASAEKLKLQDVVLQPNIAKPERPALSKTWMFGNSFLTMRDLERPGWIEVVSRRPSGSAGLICRRDHFLEVMKDGGPPALKALFMDGQDNGGSDEPPPDEASNTDSATDKDYEAELDPISFASHLFFHMSPLPETTPELTDVSDAPTLSKSLGLLDRTPVIDTHKVGIMYAGPGQTNEIEILANTHGSQAYSRFLDGIGRLVHLRTEKEVYTGSLDPEEDGEYAYAWWDDIRQILFHTATLMPNREHDPMFNYKKRHIGNDYVRIIWNDSGLPYAFDTLKTAFQFVNIIIEPHSVGTICAFSNDAHENEYFRVIVQTAEGMTECTPVGQFKIVSAVNLPHIVRHLCIFADCFTSIFSSTDHDTLRVEIKSNWNSRLDSMERFRKNVLSLQQQNSNDNGSTTSTSVHI